MAFRPRHVLELLKQHVESSINRITPLLVFELHSSYSPLQTPCEVLRTVLECQTCRFLDLLNPSGGGRGEGVEEGGVEWCIGKYVCIRIFHVQQSCVLEENNSEPDE